MAKMLGKVALHDRGKYFLWCCVGHDHTNRMYVKVNRKIQRKREKRALDRQLRAMVD